MRMKVYYFAQYADDIDYEFLHYMITLELIMCAEVIKHIMK